MNILQQKTFHIGQSEHHRAFSKINLSHLRHNLGEIQKVIPASTGVMAVVKADAYGHGAVMMGRTLQECGVSHFAVAEINEAVALRKAGIGGEILILGYTPVCRKDELIRYRLTQSIINEEYADSLCDTAGVIQAHVKLDTGMNRLGERTEDIGKLRRIYKQMRLQITGTYSHLARSDRLMKQDILYTRKQISRFFETVQILKNGGFDVGRTHIQSSYGILNHPGLPCDLVRPGIALYGVLSDDNDTTVIKPSLRPVMSLKSQVAMIKNMKAGETVGYGDSYRARRDGRIAVISIGYADGIPRNLSGKGFKVLIGGQAVKVVGNICMDQMLADISDVEGVRQGDMVTLIGEDGGKAISVNHLSRLGDTINNEILSRLGSRIGRVYCD